MDSFFFFFFVPSVQLRCAGCAGGAVQNGGQRRRWVHQTAPPQPSCLSTLLSFFKLKAIDSRGENSRMSMVRPAVRRMKEGAAARWAGPWRAGFGGFLAEAKSRGQPAVHSAARAPDQALPSLPPIRSSACSQAHSIRRFPLDPPRSSFCPLWTFCLIITIEMARTSVRRRISESLNVFYNSRSCCILIFRSIK